METVPGCKTTKQTVQQGAGIEVAKGRTVTVSCTLDVCGRVTTAQVHATGIVQETGKKVAVPLLGSP
jgi:hypothetical protein